MLVFTRKSYLNFLVATLFLGLTIEHSLLHYPLLLSTQLGCVKFMINAISTKVWTGENSPQENHVKNRIVASVCRNFERFKLLKLDMSLFFDICQPGYLWIKVCSLIQFSRSYLLINFSYTNEAQIITTYRVRSSTNVRFISSFLEIFSTNQKIPPWLQINYYLTKMRGMGLNGFIFKRLTKKIKT